MVSPMLPSSPEIAEPDLPDVELAHRIVAGDHKSFEVLMRRFNRPLYRTARSIVKDDTDAEDVVQEAYLLAYRNMHAFRGDARLLTWLTRIVVNQSIAQSRKKNRQAEVIALDGGATWKEAAEMNNDDLSRDQPESSAARAEARRLIERKIDQLPEAFRTVFVLRSLEEISVEETAVCLGIPEATVRTRYFRAKALLRESLSREIDFALEDAFAFAGDRCDRIVAGVLRQLERTI